MAIEKKLYPPEDKPKPNNVVPFPVPEDSPLNNCLLIQDFYLEKIET